MAAERVCSLAEIPEGEVRVVACAGGRSLAVSNIDGELHAIENICSHDGGPLGEGRLQRGRILCPRHGAAFDAKTGQALTLPAVAAVKSYEVSIEGDDVFIECEPA